MSRRVLIAGATSGIAVETAKRLADDGDRLFLVARDEQKLATVADDLRVRGAAVETMVANLDQTGDHPAILERAAEAMDGLDTLILAWGVLGDGEQSRRDPDEARRILHTNLLAPVSLLTLTGERFAQQGSGTIVGISSVAGDRGRQSNYVYGTSKGALSLFLSGLRNHLHPAGVRVLTVKPGLIDTPMTAGIERGTLMVDASTAGRGIHRALASNGDVFYVPWFWRPIMAVIRAIPERIFKRLRL